MTLQTLGVPPDGAGKKLSLVRYVEFAYASGTIAFATGDVVTGLASGATGTVTNKSGSTATGELYLFANQENSVAFVSGESLQVGGVTRAVVSGAEAVYYIQKMVQADAQDSESLQRVDRRGASSVRFSEGSPQFDAFGRTQVSEEHTLEEYVMRYDTLAGDFEDVIVGAGSLTHLPNSSGVLLSIGTGATDKVQRTTHHYHAYLAGKSQLVEFTFNSGDTGKANVVRAAGYYDDENGVFVRLNGTVLEYVNRSKVSGTVVDLATPVAQMNGDRLNGSGGAFNISGITLDVSKDNLYWFDLQWLGAGRVRFGVFIDGARVTMHSDENANVNNGPYMTTAALPIRYETFNTAISASTSEMRFYCAVVKTEGAFDPFRRQFGAVSDMVTVASDTVRTLLMALRPAQTFNGIDNRTTLYPSILEVFNKGANPVILSMVRNATLTGGTWVARGGESTGETNTTCTAAGGSIVKTFFIEGGQCQRIEFRTFEENRRGLRRRAIVTGYQSLSMQFQTMEAAQSANVRVGYNWDELRG